ARGKHGVVADVRAHVEKARAGLDALLHERRLLWLPNAPRAQHLRHRAGIAGVDVEVKAEYGMTEFGGHVVVYSRSFISSPNVLIDARTGKNAPIAPSGVWTIKISRCF